MKQKPFTFLSKKGYVQPITQILDMLVATMVAGTIFSEAKVLPRYVQSVADTKVTGKVTDAKRRANSWSGGSRKRNQQRSKYRRKW
jgi:hypothetical protein